MGKIIVCCKLKLKIEDQKLLLLKSCVYVLTYLWKKSWKTILDYMLRNQWIKKWNEKNLKKSTDISVWYFFSKQDFLTFI